MSSQFVIRPTEYNAENIVFTEPKNNKITKKLTSYLLNSNTKTGFGIETPKMTAQFGLSVYDPSGSNGGGDPESFTYSIPLRVDFKPDEPELENESDEIKTQRRFIQYLKDLDQKAIDFGVKYSNLIFKKVYTESQRGVVEALYTPLIKPQVGKDGTKYQDTIKIKLGGNQQRTGPHESMLFFMNREQKVVETWDDLSNIVCKSAKVKAIIQPQIYMIAGKFGLKFRLIQMKVDEVKRITAPVGYAFSDAPDEKVVETTNSSKSNTHADDSDNEAEEVNEEE